MRRKIELGSSFRNDTYHSFGYNFEPKDTTVRQGTLTESNTWTLSRATSHTARVQSAKTEAVVIVTDAGLMLEKVSSGFWWLFDYSSVSQPQKEQSPQKHVQDSQQEQDECDAFDRELDLELDLELDNN